MTMLYTASANIICTFDRKRARNSVNTIAG